MALFSKKQKTETKAAAPVEKAAKQQAHASVNTGSDLSGILLRPRITEKATVLGEARGYVFDVSPAATKGSVADAIRHFYKVSPERVRVVSVPRKVKRSMRTGRTSITGGGKKAYVFLKKGESITLA